LPDSSGGSAKLFEQARAGDLRAFGEYLEVLDELILVLAQPTGPAY
jgi:hypothetical protein